MSHGSRVYTIRRVQEVPGGILSPDLLQRAPSLRRNLAATGLVMLLLIGSCQEEALAASDADSAVSGGGSSFLLIDGAAPPGGPPMNGCDRKIADLHHQLDQSHAENVVLVHPTSALLRRELLHLGGNRRAIVFCGAAAVNHNNVFFLGSDPAAPDDLDSSAVSLRAFSRIGGPNGLVALDIYSTRAGDAHTLDRAVDTWRHDDGLPGTKLATIDPKSDPASLVERMAKSGIGNVDDAARALTGMPPGTGTAQVSVAENRDLAALPPSGPRVSVTTAPPSNPAPPRVVNSSSAQPGTATMSRPEPGPARTPSPRPGSPSVQSAMHERKGPKDRSTSKQHTDHATRDLQVALLAHGAYAGRTDGIKRPDLYEAIRRFQAQSGHTPTGFLTPQEVKLLQHG